MSTIYVIMCATKDQNGSTCFGEAYSSVEDVNTRIEALGRQYSGKGNIFFYSTVEVDKNVPKPFYVVFNTLTLLWDATLTREGSEKSSVILQREADSTLWAWPCVYATTKQDAIRICKAHCVALFVAKGAESNG